MDEKHDVRFVATFPPGTPDEVITSTTRELAEAMDALRQAALLMRDADGKPVRAGTVLESRGFPPTPSVVVDAVELEGGEPVAVFRLYPRDKLARLNQRALTLSNWRVAG